ncbi:hypothetical protein NHX12_019685 [Muraenolepis orangiensis]|uniref:IQ motif containing C n=1 Tax=Muraenolepis orangiensis TaxID=630683 RepID=A0A9Q0IXP5_9TELE|nr:hypothetical protein NHX12_019685 [Muraenolepis orangiensis]
MERKALEKTFTRFQARARGHLLRKEVGRARADFEAIVREIDGNLNRLQWRDAIVPLPHFTDTDGPLPRQDSSNSSSAPKLHHCPGTPPPDRLLEKTADEGAHPQLLPEKIEAERDGLHFQKQPPVPRACSPGPQQYRLAQDVPRTAEALRLHRNTLSMEMLWLQQAIASRKKKMETKPTAHNNS